jgi:hypothetical protein
MFKDIDDNKILCLLSLLNGNIHSEISVYWSTDSYVCITCYPTLLGFWKEKRQTLDTENVPGFNVCVVACIAVLVGHTCRVIPAASQSPPAEVSEGESIGIEYMLITCVQFCAGASMRYARSQLQHWGDCSPMECQVTTVSLVLGLSAQTTTAYTRRYGLPSPKLPET